MRLIGIDPGLASFGLAELTLHQGGELVTDLRVIETEKARPGNGRSKAEDVSARARYIAGRLDAYLHSTPRVLALCVEAIALPFGRVQHSVVSGLGRVRGLIDAIAELNGLPILEATPQELKKQVAGDASADKDAVIAAVQHRYPALVDMWPRKLALRPHAADAVAAAMVGLAHPLVIDARRTARVGPHGAVPESDTARNFYGADR